MKDCEHENSKIATNLTSRVVKIDRLVDYQTGAIVSKEILRKPTGTVTVFAFDAGQGLSEHTSPYDALVQVVEGEGEFIIGGVSHIVKTGEMIIMPANIPHAVRANAPFKMMLIMIRS